MDDSMRPGRWREAELGSGGPPDGAGRAAGAEPSGYVALDAKVLIISVAAQMAGMHPQTLRQYDRLGLVQPGRAAGGGRRYSLRDVQLLREVQRLSQEDGVNLAGIKRIIDLEQLVAQLQQQIAELHEAAEAALRRVAELEAMSPFPHRELLPTPRRTSAIVVWKPRSQ